MDVRTAIERLFYPRSIAVIGASDQADKFSGRALKHLLKSDFKGAIFPVNPNRKEVQGVKCYANVKDIPAQVDVVVVVVPNNRLFEALEDCHLKGVGAALVLNSGFAEAGGYDDERADPLLGALVYDAQDLLGGDHYYREVYIDRHVQYGRI